MVRTLSDEALLAGLGSGDPDAAAAFVDRFQRRVFGMTLSILQDRQAAEEAAQEAFVRAWRHSAAYDPRRGTVAAWLVTIARNAAVNMLPAHRAYPVDPDALLGLQETRPSPDVDGGGRPGLCGAEVAPAALASTFVTSLGGVVTFMILSIREGPVGPNWPTGIALGIGGIAGSYLGAPLVHGGQAGLGQPGLLGVDRGGAVDFDAEVVQGAALARGSPAGRA